MKKKLIRITIAACVMVCIVVNSFSLTTVNAATKSLSKNAKKEYASILWYALYIPDSTMCIAEPGTYVLYDINNDGRKELIVSGPLGLRNVMFTMVYSYDGKKMHKTCIQGDLAAVSTKGIAVLDTNYSGDTAYEDTVVYTFDKNCKETRKIVMSYTCKISGEHTTKYYDASNKAISKKKFNSLYKKYKFKSIGKDIKSHDASSKKDILKTLGIKSSPKLPNGTYSTSHDGKKVSYYYDSEKPQDYAICYKAQIENGKLIIYGNYDQYTKKPSAIGTYTFKLASNCKIVSVEAEEEFIESVKFFNECLNNTSNLFCFSFKIKNGKVTKIEIAC